MTFESERQAKAYATLQIAQDQSHNAIGDYARTQDSFANQMRVLKGEIQDLAVTFGRLLLPRIKELVAGTRKLIEWFTNLSERQKNLIIKIAAVVGAIGPLLIIIAKLATAVKVLIPIIMFFHKIPLVSNGKPIGTTLLPLLTIVSKKGSPIRGAPFCVVDNCGYCGSKFKFNKKSLTP